MTGDHETRTVGGLPTPGDGGSRLPAALTRAVWLLWVVSLGVSAVWLRRGGPQVSVGPVAVDGLTVLMWTVVTFFGGVVHSYSRRYMAGNREMTGFFGRVFAFTLVVMALVAADGFALFWAAWLAMGLVMAGLIGHGDWPQAQAAGALARRYFLASSALLAAGLAALWWHTGATTVSGVGDAVGSEPSTAMLAAAGALLLAAMTQSALVPFQGWLLSSMTAPTPASALMHAGFVNAGGILLVRFAPVVTVDARVMLAVVVVGAVGALTGKLLKSVRTDVKGALGCSTVGQMGFMIMQAGLGFFAAAVTHLLLHGFYKAYRFLASGSRVAHEHPAKSDPGSTGVVGAAVGAVTAVVGAGLFVVLTGKGSGNGLLLAGLVGLTVLHAARDVTARPSLPGTVRYGAVPLVALPAVAVYGGVYRAVEGLLVGLPAVGTTATEPTAVHALVATAFLAAYLVVETGVHRRSRRLYVTLLNAGQPPSRTTLTSTEEYDEY
jgi:NAD(P)H-quinone oxidoreductase subunit 5